MLRIKYLNFASLQFKKHMKTIFTSIALLFAAQSLVAQGCNDLFISEYLEGSGNNKGFEIYNPTANAIDLGPYVLQRWSNGAATSTDEINLQGTIPAYGTWVVVNGQTTDEDLGGGSTSPACDPAMQALASQLDNAYPAPTYFNGDDALIFIKNGVTPVDIFGKWGEDPGTAWTDNEAAGYTSADGGTWLTANKTLRRKASITSGVTVNPPVFYALAEYDSLPSNTWNGLGWHGCVCDPNYDPNFTPEVQMPVELSVFPNPVTNGVLTINANMNILAIEMYDQSGRQVMLQEASIETSTMRIETNELMSGVYMVNVHLEGRKTFTQRVVIR